MVWQYFNVASVVDAGFVLLVSAACIKSMTGTGSAGERVAQRWRSELRELERVLRELITEAATASTSFDRRLVQRKSEIEIILKKLEAARSESSTPEVSAPRASKPQIAVRPQYAERTQAVQRPQIQAKSNRRAVVEEEELPNDSWADVGRQLAAELDRESLPEDAVRGLEALIDETEDTITLSESVQRETGAERRKAEMIKNLLAPPPARSLNTQIEVLKADQPEDETFRRLSIMDPTAYKIARRLLVAGTEIHVVARKLDIPVSEVRLLDKLMREESDPVVEQERSPNYIPTETVPAKKIVRDRETQARANAAQAKAAAQTQANSRERRPAPSATPERTKRESFEYVELDRGDAELSAEDTLELAIEREIALL